MPANEMDVASAGVQTCLANSVVIASGNVVLQGFASRELSLYIVIGSVSGTAVPSITFTVQEVDPGDLTTPIGASASGAAIIAAGTQRVALAGVRSPAVKVSWVVTGTTPSFGGVFATVVGALAPDTVQGAAGTAQWLMRDDFIGVVPEVLADQVGAAGVQTFTFTNPVVLLLVESVGAALVSRVIPGTVQTPTASLGVRVTDEKVYLPTPAVTTVKVYAPIGAVVNMMGWPR